MTANHWDVTTSTGRRVSLLCEEKKEYQVPPYGVCNSSPTPPPPPPTPPLSPDYRRPYAPIRTDSISSACSSTSSLSTLSSQSLYSPRTPPNMHLPPLDKLLPVSEVSFFPSKLSTYDDSPIIAPTAAMSIDGSLSPTSTHATTVSTPPSPKTAAANPAVKRSSRRYACHCGKSFTTSGHLARHTRIHTGEKNYTCPEAGCGARFSRQDNCMQHYRTHQSGTGSKRAVRKRRMSAETVSSRRTESVASEGSQSQSQKQQQQQQPHEQPQQQQQQPQSQPDHSYPSAPTSYLYPNYFEPFGCDGGLAALANIACSGYS